MGHRSARLARLGVVGVVAVLAIIGAVLVVPRSASAVDADPCAGMSDASKAARPVDMAERYGLTDMHADGFDGRGTIAAVLQFGQSADIGRLHEFQRCVGMRETPTTQSIYSGGTFTPVDDGDPRLPAPAGEAQSDVEVLPATAPGLDRLYVLVSPLTTGSPEFYPTLVQMLDGLRSGAATDGRHVDVVSFSYGGCEADLSTAPDAAWRQLDPALQRLSETGTWFFKGSGDAGSTDCTPFPACGADGSPEARVSVHFPSSSPWVTAVGGLQYVARDGVRLTDPKVWNEKPADGSGTANCAGGGGGVSTVFERPSYQDVVPGGAAPATRGVPDIAGLAGAPGYITLKPPTVAEPTWHWMATGGDSLAGPMYAGAFASLRTALAARGVAAPARVNPMLYDLARDPATYATVFGDIVRGGNVVYPNDPAVVGHYTAETGYDLASGLGEVRMDRLLAVLAPVAPHFTG